VSPTVARPPAAAEAQPAVRPASFDPASFDPASFDPVAVDPVAVDEEGVRDQVETVLAEFLARKTRLLTEISPELAPAAQTAREFVLDGGKRLRAAFCYWGWRAAGGARHAPEALIAAAALELLQAAALVHDDLMDRSPTRRGGPSVHRRFAEEHARAGRRGDPERFGDSAALIVGDLLLSWCDELFARTASPASPAGGDGASARDYFDVLRTEVMAGQLLETVGTASDPAARGRERLIAQYKSARYTVQRPLQLGAALAGGRPELLSALGEFGLPIGEAFQLRDDAADAEEDAREGRPTLLATLGASSPEQRVGALREEALAVLADAPFSDPAARAALHRVALAATR
jgi:geranylgeranyl diphosphate synthase type I